MTSTPFAWRAVRAADLPVLAALYRDAARQMGPLVYTPVQVRAWASFPDDAAGFERYILEADTWLAGSVEDGATLGFCGVAGTGETRELQSLYVTPAHARQGLGSEMLRRTLARAEAAGAKRFEAWVTPLSRPVFLAAGFALTRRVVEPFAGTLFERYRVERG
jgi:putative acetyltransferase